MDRLNVNPEELKGIGQNIISQGEDFSSLLNTIKNHNSNLQNSWKGEDADKYTSKIEEQAKVMEDLAEAIENIGEFVIQIADAYVAAKEEAMNNLK